MGELYDGELFTGNILGSNETQRMDCQEPDTTVDNHITDWEERNVIAKETRKQSDNMYK